MNYVTVTVRLPADLKAEADARAFADDRSFTKFVERSIRATLAAEAPPKKSKKR